MADHKSVDELVVNYIRAQRDLATTGAEIRESGYHTVVMFADLVGSTALKVRVHPDEWLGYIYRFVVCLEEHATGVGGTIVKRIGDEVMLTFPNVSQSEAFLERLRHDSALHSRFKLKIAVDAGTAYHLRFQAILADDPYGPVVDRCARLANLAAAGSVLASASYVNECSSPGEYQALGEFHLKGLPDPEEVFIRPIEGRGDSAVYLEPLIRTLNDRSVTREGYRTTTRQFSTDNFAYNDKTTARPFLVRELLNVPQLAESMAQFVDRLDNLDNPDEAAEYLGYMVDWVGVFTSYTRLDASQFMAFVSTDTERIRRLAALLLPMSMFDIVKPFRKGERVRVRGIITKIDALNISINYVSISQAE